ncbi:PREDICTED: CST complex subunit CTC1-like [Branchiostoma belcheri]|uniref:CST complex subunit CTC1 n=1 Tax=Branchiostoma belcheri TaxID=7741 RepID=A0A6P4YE92_BRABE|nr:PREDICTED: CST complex subunit CTC1-like [Branchiostoma belcheri]
MDELLAAVEECTGRKISDVEKDWLRDLYHHVEKNVSSSGDISSSEVTLAVVDQVLSTTPGKELPLSFSFISVEQLVQSQHQACCSHLSTVNQREGTNISTIDTPVRPLDHIRALLLGRLTSGPNSLSVGRNNRAGQLYVEDNTGVVLCETLTFKANIFEELVFLPSWSYIPLSSHKQGNKGYLELTAPPCRLIKTCKVKEQDSVVLVPVAATILKNRKGKATKVISIQGRVSELSTILRVKEVVFFMFKLSCPAEQQHIPVIIKGPKLIHLYHLLEPRRDYIITGLKPTTLFKGSADSRNVYCSTAGTQVLPQSTEPQTVACLLSVLSASAVPVGSDGGTSETHTCSHGGGVRQKFCSYQGTITACVNSDVGIYQLDGKVRLHLGYQLHVSEGRGLRVGACVAVYNAHLVKEHTQGDAVCLSCCTASCVVIQSFSTLNSPYKPPSSHSAALKHLIYHLNPNLYELCSLLTAVRQLRLKFSSPIISGVVTSLFQQPSPVTGRLVLPQRQRNIYTEFLAEQHCCAPLAGLSSVTKLPSFQVPTVHELLQLAQQQAEMEQNWARHSSFTSSDPSNALCWTYMVLQPEHFNPPLLLVSQLTCSRHSGELQLEDNTGRVACVISQSTEAPSYPHLCTNACQSSGKPLVLVNSCPFVHPWNLNWLIRVDRYQLVVERFMHAKNENLASDQSDHKDFMTGCYIRISVQFSMCDVVNLYKVKRAGRLKHGPGVKMLDQVSGNTAGDLPTKKCEIDNPNSHRKRKGLEVSKSCKVACEDPTDQSARIYTAKDQSASHREDVCSAPRTDPISSKHQFPLCQPSSSSDNKRDDQAAPQGLELQNQQYVCQNFFLVHKDYPVVQQSADRKVTQGFYSSGLFLGNAVVGENSLRQQHDVNAGEGRNMMEAIKEVAVLFTGDAVQWYTVMHEGCLYRLVCPDSTDTAVFATKVSSAALNRAVDATNCRTCVVLPTGVFVEVLSEHRKDLCASRLDPVLSVEDLCKTKSSLHSRLISLSCSLVSCKYDVKHPNDGSSKPLSRTHKLAISSMVIQDLNSPFYTMTIYANFLAVPYALGLLPGAVLTLRRLEVRLSKKNKMYCYFNSSSSVRVEALSHRDMKESITTGPSAPTSLDNLQNIPKVFLGQLINSEARQQVMVKVICQVVCIRYLYMQYTCSSCGQIFSNGQCQNRPCTSSSSDPGHFTAKAR